MNMVSDSEFASLHIESYGLHPEVCDLCNEGDRCYVVQLDDFGGSGALARMTEGPVAAVAKPGNRKNPELNIAPVAIT